MSDWYNNHYNPAAEDGTYLRGNQEPQDGAQARQTRNRPISAGTALTIDVNMSSSHNNFIYAPTGYSNDLSFKTEDIDKYGIFTDMQRSLSSNSIETPTSSSTYGSPTYDYDGLNQDGFGSNNKNYGYHQSGQSIAGAHGSFGSTYNNSAELTPRYNQRYQQQILESPVALSNSATYKMEAATSKREYQCLHPGCTQRPFGRSADLARHLQLVHGHGKDKDTFVCDYTRCHRNAAPDSPSIPGSQNPVGKGPFHRRDHYRDHLRLFHMEDLPKRGGGNKSSAGGDGRKGVSGAADESKGIAASWWRCNKCLGRVRVRAFGFECPKCRQMCEVDRQDARRRLAAAGASSSHSYRHKR